MFSSTMKTVLAVFGWSWYVTMQWPRTLTKCRCLSFDTTSMCCCRAWGECFCFNFRHFTRTTDPSLNQPLYNCTSRLRHHQYLLSTHTHTLGLRFQSTWPCEPSPTRWDGSKLSVASSISSSVNTWYGGRPIDVILIGCGTCPEQHKFPY